MLAELGKGGASFPDEFVNIHSTESFILVSFFGQQ